MRAFITGSRAYGTPTPESDIDLVAWVSEDDLFHLREQAEKVSGSFGDSLCFGKLNLLVMHSEREFNAWLDATAELVARKPVTREEAIVVIDRHLEKLQHPPIAEVA